MFERLKTAFRQLVARPSKISRDRERLLQICMWDAATVARLVEYERSRRPAISKAEAYRKAIERYLRDNN